MGPQVDAAGDAFVHHACRKGLDDVRAGKQLCRDAQEVGLYGSDVAGGNECPAVERDAHLGQSADTDQGALAGRTVDLHTGDACQGVGDGRIRQLANVHGRDAVLDVGRFALDLYGPFLRLQDAALYDDFCQFGGVFLGVLRGCVFRRLRALCSSRRARHAGCTGKLVGCGSSGMQCGRLPIGPVAVGTGGAGKHQRSDDTRGKHGLAINHGESPPRQMNGMNVRGSVSFLCCCGYGRRWTREEVLAVFGA